MSMDVDEAWGDDLTFHIDLNPGVAFDFSNRCDAVARDRHVAGCRRGARSVDDSSIAKNKIGRHGLASAIVLRRGPRIGGAIGAVLYIAIDHSRFGKKWAGPEEGEGAAEQHIGGRESVAQQVR